jgi:hypothetical protein
LQGRSKLIDCIVVLNAHIFEDHFTLSSYPRCSRALDRSYMNGDVTGTS